MVPGQVRGVPAHDSPGGLSQGRRIPVPVSLVAVAALLLSVRSSLTAESLIGYASVLALVGVAAMEYRLGWKRPLSRG